MSRIYVASSWRNGLQPGVVRALRYQGHEVYDFRNPKPGDKGFGWSGIDLLWEQWDSQQFRAALDHPLAIAGFKSDHDAMVWADTCVLVLPCGRSAHLEAGEFIGAGKRLFILLSGKDEPELMYKGATAICVTLDELLDRCGPRLW
jgi:hypothetical protein